MTFKGLDFKWHEKLAFMFGFKPQKREIPKEENALKIKADIGESVLREYMPGIFFTNGYEVVNFNSQNPTYRNIELKK